MAATPFDGTQFREITMSDNKIVSIPSAPVSGSRFAAVPHEDHAEIMGIAAAYGRFYDDDRIDDFLDLLTDDAVFHANMPGALPDEVQGREALKGFFGGAREICNTTNVQPRHCTTNVIIANASTNSAEVTVTMAYAEATDGGALEFKMIGQYDFHLVKQSGRWSISRWSMRYDK